MILIIATPFAFCTPPRVFVLRPPTDKYKKYVDKKELRRANEKKEAANTANSTNALSGPKKVSPKFPRFEYYFKRRSETSTQRKQRESRQRELYPLLYEFYQYRSAIRRCGASESASRLNQFFYFASNGKGVKANEIVQILLSQDIRNRWCVCYHTIFFTFRCPMRQYL